MSIGLTNAQAIIDSANKEELYTVGLQALLQNATVLIDDTSELLVIRTTIPADRYELAVVRQEPLFDDGG